MQLSTIPACTHCGQALPNPYFLHFEQGHSYCTQACMDAVETSGAYAMVGDVANTAHYHQNKMLKREWT